jgi:hypothetical protein
MMTRAFLPALCIFAATACAPAKSPKAELVSLRFDGTPATASVYVDDILLGPLSVVAAHGVAVPRATHHVTVQAPGYFPDDRVLDLESATVLPETAEKKGPVSLHFDLVRLPE